MNNLDVQIYINRIEKQQQNLQEMLRVGVGSLILPSHQTQVQEHPQHSQSSESKKGVMLAGGVAIASGLVVSSPLRWLLVCAGAAAVVYGLGKSTSSTESYNKSSRSSDFDYASLASKLNRGLSKVNASVVDAWDTFISSQKNELKNEILQLDADTDIKDRMLSVATQTSVIEYSMSSLLMRLNSAARNSNMEDFKKVLADFESTYADAIKRACDEQISNWKNLIG